MLLRLIRALLICALVIFVVNATLNFVQSEPVISLSGSGHNVSFTGAGFLPTDTTCSANMTVLGFRQFLVDPPGQGATAFNPADPNGRFVALYVGTVAPIPQGWFDSRYASACQSSGALVGPGKAVLHQ